MRIIPARNASAFLLRCSLVRELRRRRRRWRPETSSGRCAYAINFCPTKHARSYECARAEPPGCTHRRILSSCRSRGRPFHFPRVSRIPLSIENARVHRRNSKLENGRPRTSEINWSLSGERWRGWGCSDRAQKEENASVGSAGGRKEQGGKSGEMENGISGEKELSVKQGRGRMTHGRVDRLQNLAQLRADWTRCTTGQPGLPDSQYGVSRQISCTFASEHTSPGRPSLPPSAVYVLRGL